jgi:hypothetical protein
VAPGFAVCGMTGKEARMLLEATSYFIPSGNKAMKYFSDFSISYRKVWKTSPD